MMSEVNPEGMRFTVIDCRTDLPYAGLENIPGNHPNLMMAVPVGNKHWYGLRIHECVFLEGLHLKVVRVK